MQLFQTSVSHRAMASALAVAIIAGSATAARAADAAADEGDEIFVTAQRRAQSANDVGITLQVATADTIRAQRIVEVANLPQLSPNVAVKENIPGLVPVITIRGVGLNDFSATNSPSAGVYVDDVYLGSLALMNFNFFDLERLEILKGPQGTLYGRNATAGAINVISAQPKLGVTEGRIAGSFGNYTAGDIEGAVNVPLGDTVALRVAAKGQWQGDGFFYDVLRKQNLGRRAELLGRAQLLWQPDDVWKVSLKVEGQHTRSQLGAAEFFGAIRGPNTPASATCPGSQSCINFLGYSDSDGDPFRGAWSYDPIFQANQIAATGRIEANLGNVTLTSITAYIDFNRIWGVDTDASPQAILDFITKDDVKQFSQELRAAGKTALLTWTVGASFLTDHIFSSYDGNLPALLNTTTYTSSDQHTDAYAVFADLEWQLSDTLSLLTGGRYTYEKRRNVGSTVDLVSRPPASFLSMAPFGSKPVTLAAVNAQITDNQWSWKVGLNWQPTTTTLVYGSITKGVKSGGFFAGVATNSGQLIPYKPESLISYEIGLKQRIPDAGLNFTASSFYYDYSDVQTFIRDTVGGLPIQRLGNVKDASIYGADIDLAWNPVKGLDLNAGIGLLHTELGAFATSNGAVPKGNRLPDAPGFSANLGGSYAFDLGDTRQLRFQVDARYSGFAYKDAINDPTIAADSFWVVNGRIVLADDGGWEISAWAKNLFDERYVTQGINQSALGNGFRVYGAPRTFGVSAAMTFK
ncbi:MAG: TonB-dependent receptor [Alphaproteobacteria bacterium PA4]|nr:MAG: TonB-dependent receptor [Alphaproteobacteria bacterium PA4]